MGRLDGKIAVVTGGSAGIGLATARLFVQEGAQVLITGRSEAALERAVSQIGKAATPLRADSAVIGDLEVLATFVRERYGRVDVLFANAGTARPRPFLETSEADFDSDADINFKGTFFTVQKLVPLMPPGGSVILNTSIQSRKGFAGFAVYAASKAAIRSLARVLTTELSPSEIRVNALAPGYIDTDAVRKIGLTEEQIGEIQERARTQIPMARMGTGDDIARTALFLASDDSRYVTGVELVVDGGSTLV